METSFAPSKIQTKQIKHPRAWDGKNLTKDEVAFDLGPRHLEAFDRVIQEARKRSVTLENASNEDFQLEDIQDDVQLIADRILNGRGVVIVRGWPMDRCTEAEMALLYWALGKQWGQPIVQSWKGDRLGYLTDVPQLVPGTRGKGFTSENAMTLHTDYGGIMGLMAIRRAKSGGLSGLASGIEIHNRIAATHPEYLAPLYEGYYIYWTGNEKKGERPINLDYRVPLFSELDGQVSVSFMNKRVVEQAVAERKEPLTELQRKALEYFHAVGDELKFTFMLEAGEALFVNNYAILHDRAPFEDWPEQERRRFLLRLWLRTSQEKQPVHSSIRRFYDTIAGNFSPSPAKMI